MQEFLRERWAAIALAVLAFVFIVQNRVDTSIKMFWIDLTMPLWLTLSLVTLLGILIGTVRSRRHRAD